MSKLAGILGVGTDEKFKIDGYCGVQFWVDFMGHLHCNKPELNKDNAQLYRALAYIIEHLQMIEKSKWTGKEASDAKKIKDLFPNAVSVRKSTWFNNIEYVAVLAVGSLSANSVTCRTFAVIYDDIFPNLKLYETVELDEIINREA